ncbi:MAG: DUF4143 domain-containing protein [Verrucomicrobia bacterium]|nr:DUF4143 domain-containing protein [Verrucomicrobiota bacterium]
MARSTVAGYLDILEDTLLCFRIFGYEPRLRVKERKLPKLYWTDPGIVRAVRGKTPPPLADERGALFEGLIAQVLRAYRDYRDLFEDIYYWSPSASQIEVDFILKRGDDMIGIEVKSSGNFSNKWCRGLRAMQELPGLRRRIVVCPSGSPMQTSDGIDILPFAHFAQALSQGTLWP